MAEDKTRRKRVLMGLLFGGLLLQSVLWFAPASLLVMIQQDISTGLAGGGLLISVVCLVGAVVGPFSGYFTQRFGIWKTFAVSIALVCAGALGTVAAGSFFSLLLCRMVFGVGFGLGLSLAACATVRWVPAQLRPALNSLYAVLPYIASAAAFLVSVKLFVALGENWRATLAVPGAVGIVLLLVWLLLPTGDGAPAAKKEKVPYARLAKQMLGQRQVRLICLADACDMWGFQFLSSFLPTFLYQHSGHTLDDASSLTSIFPVAGIAAGLFFGALMSRSGKRKIFTWPMHLLIFAGTLLIAFGTGWIQVAGIVLAGIGNAGWAPALYTMPMEFEGMTPAKVGVVFSIMLPLGYLAAFLSPIIGGAIAQTIGLKLTMAAFSLFALLAAGLTFSMKETRPPHTPTMDTD